MKNLTIISGLLLSVFLMPAVARASDLSAWIPTEQNLSSKESDTCTYVRGCGRRDKV